MPYLLTAFFTLPTSTLSDLQGYVGQLVTDTSLLWILAIGIPVAFAIIWKLIATGKRIAK